MAADNSSFQSWNDYLNLNGDQEKQLLDNAMAGANATRDHAGQLLNRARVEADDGNQALSATGSYQDYLRLKTQADQQYLAAQNGGNRIASLARQQQARQSGVSDEWTAQGNALEYRQNVLSERAQADIATKTKAGDDTKSYYAKQASDKAQREADDATSKAAYRQALLTKMKNDWLAQDQRHRAMGGLGAFNPFKDGTQGFGGEFNPFGFQRGTNDFTGDSGPNPDARAAMGRGAFNGLEDSQKLAQDARAAGLGAEADRYQSTATYDIGGNRTAGGY